jgi:hypothetical protein
MSKSVAMSEPLQICRRVTFAVKGVLDAYQDQEQSAIGQLWCQLEDPNYLKSNAGKRCASCQYGQ